MRIVQKLLDPSRPDAVRLRRDEKLAMFHLMYAATTLEDLRKDLLERLGMIDHGEDRMENASMCVDELLNDLRVTVPENQRINLQHTSEDYEVRLVPKQTPGNLNVIVTKEEFRQLVDCARAKCRECVLDDGECEECELYRLLTSILPLDDYHSMNLCPYNLGEWKN